MTDTKASYYQDYQDALAENARLRAEVDFANERAGKAEAGFADLHDEIRRLRVIAAEPAASTLHTVGHCGRYKDQTCRDTSDCITEWCFGCLLAKVEDVNAELAEARKSLDALRAAPSDAEIEEWRRGAATYLAAAWRHIKGDEVGLPEGMPSECRRMLNTAVALMRRATAAPAPSALRGLRKFVEFMPVTLLTLAQAKATMLDEIDKHLAAAPEAKEPSGVVVPEDVLLAARWLRANQNPLATTVHRCADWILDLPSSPEARREMMAQRAAPQPAAAPPSDPGLAWEKGWNAHVAHVALHAHPVAALDDTRRSERAEADGELQRLLDSLHSKKGGSPEWCGEVEAFIRWLARKAVSK